MHDNFRLRSKIPPTLSLFWDDTDNVMTGLAKDFLVGARARILVGLDLATGISSL